jgi:hemerythrin-like domain-containing protein
MRIPKNLQTDQDHITRFLTVLGGASVEVRNNKRAKAKFFISAYEFMKDYIDEGFFKKEEILIKILEDGGFPPTQGPVGAMRSDQKKSRDVSETLLETANAWQAGDAGVRGEVGWAANEYTSTMRQHMERLKTLIYPLIEQTIPMEGEEKVSEEIRGIVFEGGLKDGVAKYVKLIEELEEEFNDWK